MLWYNYVFILFILYCIYTITNHPEERRMKFIKIHSLIKKTRLGSKLYTTKQWGSGGGVYTSIIKKDIFYYILIRTLYGNDLLKSKDLHHFKKVISLPYPWNAACLMETTILYQHKNDVYLFGGNSADIPGKDSYGNWCNGHYFSKIDLDHPHVISKPIMSITGVFFHTYKEVVNNRVMYGLDTLPNLLNVDKQIVLYTRLNSNLGKRLIRRYKGESLDSFDPQFDIVKYPYYVYSGNIFYYHDTYFAYFWSYEGEKHISDDIYDTFFLSFAMSYDGLNFNVLKKKVYSTHCFMPTNGFVDGSVFFYEYNKGYLYQYKFQETLYTLEHVTNLEYTIDKGAIYTSIIKFNNKYYINLKKDGYHVLVADNITKFSLKGNVDKYWGGACLSDNQIFFEDKSKLFIYGGNSANTKTHFYGNYCFAHYISSIDINSLKSSPPTASTYGGAGKNLKSFDTLPSLIKVKNKYVSYTRINPSPGVRLIRRYESTSITNLRKYKVIDIGHYVYMANVVYYKTYYHGFFWCYNDKEKIHDGIYAKMFIVYGISDDGINFNIQSENMFLNHNLIPTNGRIDNHVFFYDYKSGDLFKHKLQ